MEKKAAMYPRPAGTLAYQGKHITNGRGIMKLKVKHPAYSSLRDGYFFDEALELKIASF